MTLTAFTLADQLYATAPWNKLGEMYLIGLIDPATGERHHISLMGANGNHLALALYLGETGRRRFNAIQELPMPESDRIEMILTTPQLQCAFSERSDLMKSELAAIKASGKKYRGECWPSFRSFRPGYGPSPANPEEVTLLCHAIEQALIVAEQLDDFEDTMRYENGRNSILTRVLRNGEWVTEWSENDTTLYEFPQPAAPTFLCEKISRHQKIGHIDLCFQMLPSPIGKNRESTTFPYLLMVIDPTSEMVIGFEMFSVEKQPYETLPASIVTALLQMFDRHSICPSGLNIASPVTATMLHNTATSLGIKCHVKERLPALEQAMDFMLSRMMR